jgi:putative addiction module CopG family antidote
MMTIELAPGIQQLFDAQIKAGRFKSASDLVNQAVERFLIQEEDSKLDELRASIDEGLTDLDAGRFSELSAEDIIALCRRDFNAKHGN